MSTFKTRVADFWDWYQEVAERFYHTIEEGRCGDLAEEVSGFMDGKLPGLYWVFGPGEGGGHSFTVTGEGQVAKQLLAEYWQQCAPELPNWTFYASRQPCDPSRLTDIAIRVGEEEQVDVEGMLVKTDIDEERKAIDIIAWHPTLDAVPEEHHAQILFLLLDEVLGEFGTQMWLGEIKIQPFEPDKLTRPLLELPTFIQQLKEYHGWNPLPPLQSYTLYELPKTLDSRRGDTVVGTTGIANIVFDFLENDGVLPEDPYEGLGAELVYLAIDGSVFPDNEQSEVRGNIEDAVHLALQAEQSGRSLGGAFGIHESYIDLLLLDGSRSRDVVEATLDELQLSGRSRIESFTQR